MQPKTYVITVDPSAPGGLDLAEQLAALGEVDMVSKSEIHVAASEQDVLQVTDEFPQAVMKVEVA